MNRRQLVLAIGSTSMASVSGCLDVFGNAASVLEVEIFLENAEDTEHKFHVALETEEGLSEWKSRVVAADFSENIIIGPPENAFPVALHVVVDDEALQYELGHLDSANDDFCLRLFCSYGSARYQDQLEILESLDRSC